MAKRGLTGSRGATPSSRWRSIASRSHYPSIARMGCLSRVPTTGSPFSGRSAWVTARSHRTRRRSLVARTRETGDPLGEAATFGELVHRLVEVFIRDVQSGAIAVNRREDCRLAQELLDVRRARPFGACDEFVEVAQLEVQAARVKREEPASSVGIRQRKRYREVDSTRPSRECRLENVGAVRREDEEDIDVLAQAVHLVEQFEEERLRLHARHPAFLGDEVDVLDDDGARLEEPRHLRDRGDHSQSPSGREENGPPLHAAGEIHDGQRFARPGWAEEQQSAFDRATRSDELLRVLAERDGMPVDAIEDTAWKDHVIPGHLRQAMERDDRLRPEAELLGAERNDLAPVDVVLGHESSDVSHEALCGGAFGGHHLDARTRLSRPHVLVRSGDERDERHAVRLHEVETELHDRKHAIAVQVEVDVVHGAFGQPKAVRRRPAIHEVREAEPPLTLVLGREADELRAVARLLDVRIHRDLQIRLLETLELFGDHGHPRRFATEMRAKALQQRAFGHLRAVDDVVEKALKEEAELLRRRALVHARESRSSRATERPWRALHARRRQVEWSCLVARKAPDREHPSTVRTILVMNDHLLAEAFLECGSEQGLAPARGVPACPGRTHEPHHELAELVRLHRDTDAHDLGPVRHTPTHHPSHPRRKNMSDDAIRHPPNQLDKTVEIAAPASLRASRSD